MSSQFAGNETVLELDNTRLFVQGQDKGIGLLSIKESCVNWSSTNSEGSVVLDTQLNVTLEYPCISLHAVCRDTSNFPYPCLYLLYCQEEEEEEEEESEDEGSPIEKITEMRFVPSSPNDLDELYSTLCECQALYPDPDLSTDSEYEEEEVEEGSSGVLIEDISSLTDTNSSSNGGGVYYTSVEEGFPHLSPQGRVTLEHIEQVIQMPRPEEFEAMISSHQGERGNNGDQFEDVHEDDY